MLVGLAVDPDDGDIFAARLIVRVVILSREHLIEDVEGVDVAGMHAEEDDALLQPLRQRLESLPGAVAEERFPGRKKILLGGEEGAVIFEPRLRPAG